MCCTHFLGIKPITLTLLAPRSTSYRNTLWLCSICHVSVLGNISCCTWLEHSPGFFGSVTYLCYNTYGSHQTHIITVKITPPQRSSEDSFSRGVHEGKDGKRKKNQSRGTDTQTGKRNRKCSDMWKMMVAIQESDRWRCFMQSWPNEVTLTWRRWDPLHLGSRGMRNYFL